MGFLAHEIPALSTATSQWCPRCPTGLSPDGWWLGEVGEAGWCIPGIVFFPVMVTVRPQLPHFCISTPATGLAAACCPCAQGKVLLPLQVSGLHCR